MKNENMQVKVFGAPTTSLLQQEINAWLNKNQNITLINTLQSESTVVADETIYSDITVSLWYLPNNPATKKVVPK